MPHRQVLNGIFWVLRTGAPWRDMPERYGKWQTVYDRFSRWRREGFFQHLLAVLCDQARSRDLLDFDFAAMDGTTVRAHKAAAGARKKKRQGKPRS
jgi:transposase